MNRPIDNEYISKNRYYELKYFCYQYPEWKKEKTKLKIFPGGNFGKTISKKQTDITCDLAVKLSNLDYKIETVDKCIAETAPEIEPWLKKCIVEGKSYDKLVPDGVPCCREYFYKRYRLFFSRLNQVI